MPLLEFNNIGFASLTCAVPANTQTIDENPDCPDGAYRKKFVRQMGIRKRHISLTEQTCTDTGFAAAKRALKNAGWSADSLDGLIFMSQTPDFNPATGNAHILHYRLGMRKDSLAFDITLGCSSFPYGLSVCAALMQQPQVKRLCMISGDTNFVSYNSVDAIRHCGHFLFGEGTTALLLEQVRETSPLRIALYSDGAGYKYLYDPYSGCRNAWRQFRPAVTANGVKLGAERPMDGIEITTFSTDTVVESIRRFLEDTSTDVSDYDGIVLHQANKQIVKTIGRRLKVDPKKLPLSLDRYANTSGASASLTIVDAYANDPRECLHLLVCAYGIGLSWGIADIRIRPAVITSIFPVEDEIFEEGLLYPVTDERKLPC
ncbi:MAG: hypothetical protein IJU76_00225 [Desulfovibrionaceae bacterium]|nr:hypothetical protein [Desulfovibrionaceae bacterium]